MNTQRGYGHSFFAFFRLAIFFSASFSSLFIFSYSLWWRLLTLTCFLAFSPSSSCFVGFFFSSAVTSSCFSYASLLTNGDRCTMGSASSKSVSAD